MVEINKNKTIGDVVFIVEGTKTEPKLLKKILTKIYNYKYIQYNRDKRLQQKNDDFDTNIERYKGENKNYILIVNTQNSNISSIFSKEDNGEIEFSQYVEDIIEEIIEKYGINIDNTATFYLFDRDCKSNLATQVEEKLEVLKNPYENEGDLAGGMLLLSYPCIESFVVSSFEDKCCNNDTYNSNMKQYRGDNGYRECNIAEETIKKYVEEFLYYLEQNDIKFDFNEEDDNLGNMNIQINSTQEQKYKLTGKYSMFSSFVECLIYLGLVKVKR